MLHIFQDESLDSESLERTINRHLRFSHLWLPWPENRQWQDHYNAACAYALSSGTLEMAGSRQPTATSRHLRHDAIEELRAAFRSADSGYTTVTTEKGVWLTNSDQDLMDLREDSSSEFANLTSQVYPHEKPRGGPVRDVVRRLALYDEQLISELAHAMEDTWHKRKYQSPVRVHAALQWLYSEQEVWQTLEKVAEAHARDWPTRLDLHQKIFRIADPESIIQRDWPRLSRPGESEEATAKNVADELRKLLDRYEAYLGEANPAVAKTQEWLAAVRKADASGADVLPRNETRRLCNGYATAWQAVAEYFAPQLPEHGISRPEVNSLTRHIPQPHM